MDTIRCPQCHQGRPATNNNCWNCGHTPGSAVNNPQPVQPVFQAATAALPAQATTLNKPTSAQATMLAVVVVIALLFAGTFGFFQTPAGQEQWQHIVQSVPRANNNVASAASVLSGGDDFTCPDGITKLEFDSRGVLQEPYPVLKTEPQRYCFDKKKYQDFLSASGKTESGREINGLDWLSETIAYPNYPSMLEAVKTAIQAVNVAGNMSQVGWIEIPGYGDAQPAAAPSNGQKQPVAPGSWNPENSDPQADSDSTTATPPPTATAMATVAAADIPTLMPSTPMPSQHSIQNFTPEPTRAAMVATAVVDALQQTCVTVIEAQNFWDLDDLPFWSQGVTYLEFRLGESGASAMSNHVGGNGPDANKRWVCIRQIHNWPGQNLNLGKGITAVWNGAQARVNPMYGVGDWISNGKECGSNGLWLFECKVTYPPGTPTPTPQPIPTSTPRSTNMSLDNLIALFVKNTWSTQSGCQISGDQVLIRLGACALTSNPSYWVDFSPIWDRREGNNISVGPCIQIDPPKLEWNNSGICIHPFK
jgi:hypothetical protein